MNLQAGNMVQKYNHVRSNKLTRSAKGVSCKVMSPVCNRNSETSILAHLDSMLHGKSTSIKADDSAAAICCSACHEWLALETDVDPVVRYEFHTFGVIQTWEHWFNEGVLITDRDDIRSLHFINFDYEHDIAIKLMSDWIRKGVVKIA